MTKIVVANSMGLSPDQKARLEKLGDVTFYDDMPASGDEWLKRCQGFDIVCSWMAGLREKYGELKDVYISVPFVGVSSFADPKVLKTNNITISNSPGCNRHAVSEWIVYMILEALRHLGRYINTKDEVPIPFFPASIGLAYKNVTILGQGNIGGRVGEICKAFEMNVTFFKREDNLTESVKNADVIVDALSANPSSKGLISKDFFDSVKKGAVFISPTVGSIVDLDAMLAALDTGQLSFIAHDVMDTKPGDTGSPIYQKLRQHSKVLVTPHIAAFTDVTTQIGNDMMIDNIEAWLKGKPTNVFEG